MAIKGYFYNAHKDEHGNYDRLYNDEDFCRYMYELIGNGVFPTPSTQYAVTSNSSNMNISVGAGEAWIEGHKVSNDANMTLVVETADPIFNRIDRVVIGTDSRDANRGGYLKVIKGVASVSPVAPELTRNTDVYELGIADIYIPAGSTVVSAANITDTRPNSELCGWVAGLIQQIDISSLYEQWRIAYSGLYSSLQEWQEEIKREFDTWFYQLNNQLTVGAYIRTFHKVVTGGPTVSNIIPLDMENYSYDTNDVIFANLNGLSLTQNLDYVLTINNGVATITLDGDMSEGNTFEIFVLKSSMAQTSGGLMTRVKGDKFLYCKDAMPETVKAFVVNDLGTTNIIAVNNRNLYRLDQFGTSKTIGNVTFALSETGYITAYGTTSESSTTFDVTIDKNAFVPGKYYTMNTGKDSGVLSMTLTLMINRDVYSEFTGSEFVEGVVYYERSGESPDYVYTPTSDVEPQAGTTYYTKTVTPLPTTYTSTNAPVTFVIDGDVISATCTIGVTGLGIEVDESIYPQIEYGDEATEYVAATYSTFVYDGATKPIFTDTINNIWSNDDGVSDMFVIFTVLGSDNDGDLIDYPLDS